VVFTVPFCIRYVYGSSSSSSSSSSAQRPLLSQGILQKLLPAVSIPCSIPPISLPQLPGIFHHTICNDFDLYKDKTFHEPILRFLYRFVGRISDSPAIAYLDFVTMLFSGAGCQPCVQSPAILEDRLDCFLVCVRVWFTSL